MPAEENMHTDIMKRFDELNEIVKQIPQLYEKGYRDGYAEGYSRGREDLGRVVLEELR